MREVQHRGFPHVQALQGVWVASVATLCPPLKASGRHLPLPGLCHPPHPTPPHKHLADEPIPGVAVRVATLQGLEPKKPKGAAADRGRATPKDGDKDSKGDKGARGAFSTINYRCARLLTWLWGYRSQTRGHPTHGPGAWAKEGAANAVQSAACSIEPLLRAAPLPRAITCQWAAYPCITSLPPLPPRLLNVVLCITRVQPLRWRGPVQAHGQPLVHRHGLMPRVPGVSSCSVCPDTPFSIFFRVRIVPRVPGVSLDGQAAGWPSSTAAPGYDGAAGHTATLKCGRGAPMPGPTQLWPLG